MIDNMSKMTDIGKSKSEVGVETEQAGQLMRGEWLINAAEAESAELSGTAKMMILNHQISLFLLEC